jgi:hypothetical protein
MNTESRRRASAAYHAKREAEGLKKVTLWLSPEARFKLDALKAAAGSKDKAADAAILAWGGPETADKAAATKPKAPVKAKVAKPTPKPAGKSAIKLNIPLASDIVRKPMQKTGKK